MANPLPSTSNAGTNNAKRKRKKVMPANANPLFTKWITEWKDEAVEKGWKSQYNYSKALKTLKMFPLCLETGKDCKMLQNFGDKICMMLDEKLVEHKRNQDKVGIADNTPVLNLEISTQPQVPKSNHTSNNLSTGRTSTIHAISDNSDSGKKETASHQTKKKRKTSGARPREYVPAYRSGPYALILTLYRYSLDPDYKGFMTKTELMHAAQPLADKSFTIPDPGSHYTAWSSMGSLVKRILVLKIGSPAKYHLTQEGADLGERLERAEKDMDNPQDRGFDDDSNSIFPSKTVPQPSPAATLSSLDNLDHLNLSAEERAFILDGMTQGVHPVVQKALDDNPVYISDDEEIIYSDSRLRNASPSKLSRAHSLSPSMSPVSSPEIRTSRVSDCVGHTSLDIANDHNANDSVDVSVRECEDDYFHNDDVVNTSDVSQQSPPIHCRLPPLSPFSHPNSHSNRFREQPLIVNDPSSDLCAKQMSTIDSSNILDSSVIEIGDDDDDGYSSNNKFTEESSSKGPIDKAGLQFSQHAESYGDHKKNIFSNIDHQSSSQNSQSDDDDLPDIDLCVPLSKRLFDKGVVSSQLLSQFNVDLKKSDNVSLAAARKCEQLPTTQFSSRTNEIVILEDDDEPGPREPLTSRTDMSRSGGHAEKLTIDCEVIKPTSITDKSRSVERAQKLAIDCEVIKSWSLAETQRANDAKGFEHTLESCPTPEFTFLPGSYEIVLCVDNREFYGSKSNSKTLLPDLIKSGINCDLRLLHIGDIVWVAREKGVPNECPTRANRKELVLNFAIERKRMDDLVSSITGGRLKEQKFRLKHSGISELIILIEEYGSIQNFSISEDRIKQSIVNSQIIDGFQIKRCGSSKEAVMYLSIMTRFIQKYYGNKTLHAASHEYTKANAAKSTVKDEEFYLMSFETFNETSIKHKALTVKEMFGKHLMQIPGISLERAYAITKVFPTLVSLIEAYKNCTSEKSKESLLATIKCGNKERNLGIAVSRIVHMLYNTSRLT